MLKPVHMAELKALLDQRSKYLEGGNSENAQKVQEQINELKERFKEMENKESNGTQ
ncbi:hypothetical protein K9N68_39655 (plasmid) [Kovacikia minuta CCNUW1]|uniref:hypothetical protein n=1 Tax=Kovacikia minuta TaxID=2931930 RepID=UPI001CCA5BAB|nr:hypothetical protein [Kovacikia minuta]UBF30772.1 hypothetical protein K9N68_39655 [Kovacikia minuta CCNUW1]